MNRLLLTRRLAHTRLRLGKSQVTLVRPGNLTQVVRQRSRVLRELLRLASQPPVKCAPEGEQVSCDTFVPADIPCHRVGFARVDLGEENPPLSSDIQHRRTLGHSTNNILRQVGTEGNKVHYRLRVQKSNGLGNLLVLPRRNVPVRASRDMERSSDVEFLQRKDVRQDLRKNFRLSFSPTTGQDQREHPDQERDESGNTCNNCRDRVPVRCVGSNFANLDYNTHRWIPLWTRRHSATASIRRKVPHG